MSDDERLSDAEVVRRVEQAATPDEIKRAAELVAARLRALRLRCLAASAPQPQAVPH